MENIREVIDNLNKNFESRVRLGLMYILSVNEWMDFSSFKELLNVTDGNLASHLKILEKSGMITIKKQFVGNKPQTLYKATYSGRNAYRQHMDSLAKLLNTK